MTHRPPEIYRELAIRIAGQLSSGRGAELLSLMQQIGIVAAGAPRDPRATPAPPARTVGIWREVQEGGQAAFVRQADAADALLWPHADRIGPKQTPRIVYLGESAARGFLHDPDFTPSQALEATLRSLPGLPRAEVIDLTRTDQTLGPLLDLAADALVLEPDALVVFAGNNWGAFLSIGKPELFELARAVRVRGTAAAVASVRATLVGLACRYVERLATIAREHRIPIVLVIPEFNLGDWRNRGMLEHPPWLPEHRNNQWEDAYRQALLAHARRDRDQLARLAQRLIDLDQGLSPAGSELLAEAHQWAGDRAEARRLYELARDADPDWTGNNTPRCPALLQDTIRNEAARHGLPVVDLPRWFAAQTGDELPDRRYFLDYCHLTVDGIRLATRAIAETLAPLLPGAAPSPRIHAVALDVDPLVERRGHFYAAILNCVLRQPDSVIAYHCEQAARHPAIAEVMRALADSLARSAPNYVCESFLTICRHLYRSSADSYYVALLAGLQFDARLVRALARPLGPDVVAEIDALLLQEHGVVARQTVDLLPYVTTTPSGFALSGSYLQARSSRSRFDLFCEEQVSIRLTLTGRAPGHEAPAVVALMINGQQIGDVALGGKAWATANAVVPAAAVSVGQNEITLVWPALAHAGEQALASATHDIEYWNFWEPQDVFDPARGASPEVLARIVPVFGELYSFTASVTEP